MTKDLRRIPRRDRVGFDVVRHDRARADHGARTDRHAGQDDRVRADPDVVRNDDGRIVPVRFRRLVHIAVDAVDLMIPAVDMHAGTEHHVAADQNIAVNALDHAVRAEIDVAADLDVLGRIEDTARGDIDLLPAAAKPAERVRPFALVFEAFRKTKPSSE